MTIRTKNLFHAEGAETREKIAEKATPELLRLAQLEVRIPRLEVVVLERLAARDGKSVDAVLARELLDLVSAHSEWLTTEIPGFAAALAWPELEGEAPPCPSMQRVDRLTLMN